MALQILHTYGGLLFSALPWVAPYCARGGVRVVSISPSYSPDTLVHGSQAGSTWGRRSTGALEAPALR